LRYVALVLALLVLLLLTWLLLSGLNLNLNSSHYVGEIAAIEQFSGIEHALDWEVLTARAGLTRQYDTITNLQRKLDEALASLWVAAENDRDMTEALAGLSWRVNRQQALIERFKTNDALLRNSAAYFSLLSGHLAPSRQGAVVQASASLSAAMIRLSTDASDASWKVVRSNLDALAGLETADEDRSVNVALPAHGELLFRLLPATDSILRELIASTTSDEQLTFRSIDERRQGEANAVARRHRLVLYLASVVLVIV